MSSVEKMIPRPAGQEVRHRNGSIAFWLPAAALLVAAAALAVSLAFSGAADPRQALDPGAFVRWALPAATTLHHLMLAVVVGCLVLAATILPQHTQRSAAAASDTGGTSRQHAAFTRVMTVASVASAFWALSALAVLVLTYSDLVGKPLSTSDEFASQLVYYATDLIVGQAWLAVTIIAFVVSTLTFAVRSIPAVGLTALLSLTAVIPISLIGHAAGSDDHYAGVGALALHWVGVLVWVGGVAALAAVSPVLARTNAGGEGDTGTHSGLPKMILERFSALAGVAFFLVLVSGVINSVLRLGSWEGLFSPYGQLILVKTAATLILGAIGFAHRQWAISRAGQGTNSPARAAWRLITVEVLIMSGVVGVAVALSRTPPPVPLETEPALTPAEILTGYPLPAELTWMRWFTQWRWDWLWVAAVVIAAVVYLHGLRRMRAQNQRWSRRRTVSWMAGLVLLLYVTCSAPTIYGMVLFSVQTASLLALALLIPWLLVLGAPLQLAALTVLRREDGSRGVREWIEAPGRSARYLASPVLSGTALVIATAVFYYTQVFGLALEYWAVHQAANACFLVIGFWFISTLLGTGVHRLAPCRVRTGTAAVVAAVFLIWSLVLAGGVQILQADWFGNMGRTWGTSLAVDQQLAGISVLLAGFLPAAIIMATLMLRTQPQDRHPRREPGQ